MDIKKPYVAKVLENGQSKWIMQFFYSKTVWKCSVLTDSSIPKLMFKCGEKNLEEGIIRTVKALCEITRTDTKIRIEWIKT